MMLFPILFGAVLGGLVVVAARRLPPAGQARLLALGLVVAALVYVGLALAGADRRWLAVEAVGLGVFAVLGWLGVRASIWWLALGWVAHVGWDVGLHLDRSQAFVGAWYPLLCVGFDLVVAGFLIGARPSASHHPLTT
jgi:uncharacterized protein DUF6010